MPDAYPVPTTLPTYSSTPSDRHISHGRLFALLDSTFAGLGLLLTFWFAALLLLSGLALSWSSVLLLLGFWLVLTYLALPRMHQLMTTLYIPDYFMARTKTGDGLLGDPVNLAIVGAAEDIHAAMRRADWVMADEITLRSSLGIVRSSLTGKSYPEAPVSDLFLFGNRQDFAYQQEVDGNAAQRHHVRFWRVPEGWKLPGGEAVDWLAAGTYDKSVGLSSLTLQVTHKIDEDVDAERDYIINTVRYVDPAASVSVIEHFATPFHDRNGGGDAVRSDGSMPVLDLSGAAQRARAAGRDLVPVAPATASDPLDHHLPPTALNLVGVFIVLQLLLTLLAGLAFWLDPTTIDADYATGLTTVVFALVVAVVEATLFALTLKRFRWARLILLILASVSAIVQFAVLTAADSPSWPDFLDAGIVLLIVLSLSAPSVRQWVFAIRRRSGSVPLTR